MINEFFTDDMFNVSSSKILEEEVEKLFHFYRMIGFPNYSRDNYSLEKEYGKLKHFSVSRVFSDNVIKQNITAQGILWTYFPHWTSIKCANAEKSLIELWNDDDKLRALIKKTYLWKIKHDEPHWTHNRIRQNAKVFLSPQSVSNFRPTAAKAIYNTFGNKGDIFDMSAGFGGRMFGFSASNCKSYTGLDPSTKTYRGLIELSNDLKPLCNKDFRLLSHGSECFNPGFVDSFDLCFTSPPYFDTEKYSDEETQSYLKFSTIDQWLNGFLKTTIENCYQYTKRGGYTIINIANTPVHKCLEESTINFAIDAGFVQEQTIKMELSSISGKGRKYEPIFVFKKN